ncbi:MAG: hypothetical protein MSH65_10540 [Spirochaetia bacterium]|nr:hypothetical protein [Spirochaetia bacterium]MDY5818451.1 hypothetical protein [Treponema sp.]
MTKKYKKLRAVVLVFIFLWASFSPLFGEDGKWVIAAQKFIYARGQTKNAVTSNIEETIPTNILEKISRSLERNIMPNERFERENYKLRTERQSLYLQLSSEYKKRDSLVLNNYSDMRMKSELKAAEKKIKQIQEKLEKNIAEQKEKYEKAEAQMHLAAGEVDDDDNVELNEAELVKNLIKNIFEQSEDLITEENIALYKDSVESLFKTTVKVKETDYTEPLFEKEVVSSGINGLITGQITSYGDFISVAVDLYNYPGAKKIGSVMEVGEIKELDLITSEISRQILPMIVNTLPVKFVFSIEPEEAKEKLSIYVDDVLQKMENDTVSLDSGSHRIQFVSEGYKSAGVTYFFEGNKKYNIEVKFERPVIGHIQLQLKNELTGNIYANAEPALKFDDRNSQISINGNTILGEFITEDNETAFFYIPKKQTFDGSAVTLNPKPRDRTEYVNTRRKWMYGAYTVFMISLIPTFYTFGNFQINKDLYSKHQIDFETAKRWQTASNISSTISICCGVFWGIELIRYLVAANSVLPQNVKPGIVSEQVLVGIPPVETQQEEAVEIENENQQ